MQKTAIIYARVSTVGQAEEELPVESQLETCRRKAAELSLNVLREFIDAGISGRTDDRPAFRDALAFCKVNQVDHFICWNTSRFARNHLDAGWHKRQLNKCGTTMVYVSMNLDSSTKEGWMLESVLGVIDEFYSRQVSDDTRRSMMKNARDGYFNGGNIPYGYTAVLDGKRRRLAIVETEAVIVRDIFSAAASGSGTKNIALDLNRRGYTRRGAPWSKNTVGNLLRNWTMCGYLVFNRRSHNARDHNPESQWIKIPSFPAIVDEDKFKMVQQIISGRAPQTAGGSPRSTHLFTGMLKCGACGSNMMAETATGRSAKYTYYNCGAAIRGTGCKSRRIRCDQFDPWMADYIITRVMSIENLEAIVNDVKRAAGQWVTDREHRRAGMVAELRDIESRRKRLYNLLETTDKSALDLADLKPRLMDLNGRARQIEVGLTDLELAEPPVVADIDLMELQQFVREIVLTSNQPRKIREFFAGFVQDIVLFEGHATVNYRPDRIVTNNTAESVRSGMEWLPDVGLLRTVALNADLPEDFRIAA